MKGSQGVQLALTGRGTHWQMGVTKLDFGPGIAAQAGPFITTPTDAFVMIAVAPSATVGPRPATAATDTEIVGLLTPSDAPQC
jgi:hypothetical protein